MVSTAKSERNADRVTSKCSAIALPVTGPFSRTIWAIASCRFESFTPVPPFTYEYYILCIILEKEEAQSPPLYIIK